jgi:hypothetical protein
MDKGFHLRSIQGYGRDKALQLQKGLPVTIEKFTYVDALVSVKGIT